MHDKIQIEVPCCGSILRRIHLAEPRKGSCPLPSLRHHFPRSRASMERGLWGMRIRGFFTSRPCFSFHWWNRSAVFDLFELRAYWYYRWTIYFIQTEPAYEDTTDPSRLRVGISNATMWQMKKSKMNLYLGIPPMAFEWSFFNVGEI